MQNREQKKRGEAAEQAQLSRKSGDTQYRQRYKLPEAALKIIEKAGPFTVNSPEQYR